MALPNSIKREESQKKLNDNNFFFNIVFMHFIHK